MKFSATTVLIAVTLAFAIFICGFCVGRNTVGSHVELSAYSPASSAIDPAVPSASSTLPSASASAGTEDATVSPFPIDINTATSEQLQLIPGIGKGLAQRIIDYRDTFGAFSSIYELLEVRGIGETTFEKIRDYVTVS